MRRYSQSRRQAVIQYLRPASKSCQPTTKLCDVFYCQCVIGYILALLVTDHPRLMPFAERPSLGLLPLTAFRSISRGTPFFSAITLRTIFDSGSAVGSIYLNYNFFVFH